MARKRIFSSLRNLLAGSLVVAGLVSNVPNAKAMDFYNAHVNAIWDSEQFARDNNFSGGHSSGYTEGYDSGTHDTFADLEGDPSPNYVKITAYTTVPVDDKLSGDFRDNNSLTEYNGNVRYMSDYTNFQGRSELTFDFKAYNGNPYIDPLMFYTGEFIAEPQFRTNGVRQVDKKAILSNTNAQGEATFNLDGLQAVDGDDFIQFNIHREYNDLHFPQPANGGISVSNLLDGAAITNGQRFVYSDMTDAGVAVTADSGYHLLGLDVVRTDINNGDRLTNSVSFPTSYGNYVSNFSTNLEDLVGDNRIENVVVAGDKTSSGVPYEWLAQYGITNNQESAVDVDSDGDGHTTGQEYVADTNPTNPASVFSVMTGANGLEVPDSSTNRLYSYEATDDLISGNWTPSTNWSYGNGTNLVLDMDEGADSKWFYKGKVKE